MPMENWKATQFGGPRGAQKKTKCGLGLPNDLKIKFIGNFHRLNFAQSHDILFIFDDVDLLKLLYIVHY